jgi:hypothetical protein
MKNNSRANKGQFSIIAALLVSVILVTAVISTYSMVRHAPLQDSPKVLTAIGEMNADIKRILDFTVGYYGSILRVTGNSTYAQRLTTSYLASGLVNIARSHPEWNPSFTLDSSKVSTHWYMPESYSMGNISVIYSLAGLGIEGVQYETSSVLKVTMLEPVNPNEARLNVTRDNGIPELGLGKENFWFYTYNYDDSTWELVNPENDPIIYSNGTYIIDIPLDVDQNAYSIQVDDQRGMMVPAFYSQGSLESGVPKYTYTFDWNAAGMGSVYSALSDDTMVIEVLQNGTLRCLGQNLTLTTLEKPIPPLPVKALHVNTTISGVNREVPFQVEDWGSNYKVPLGLSTNASVFNNRNAVVFLVDHTVEKATLWWDGRDIANQTSYAWNNIYFEDDDVSSNPNTGFLSNEILDLSINMADPAFEVTSTMGDSTSRAEFFRINGKSPVYYSDPAYVIHHGIVRDIIQQEAEWNNYDGTPGIPDCPNMYSQIVLTLPANATYYTYTLRTIFVDSSDVIEDRIIDDLSILQLTVTPAGPETGECITEDGINATGFPIPSNLEGAFDSTPEWEHHWNEFMRGTKGAGVMFTDSSNLELYAFDSIAGSEVGTLFVDKQGSDTTGYIEVNPVHLPSAHFEYALDLTWHGAVVTFNGEPIYPSSGHTGLWVMVEYPPSVTVN